MGTLREYLVGAEKYMTENFGVSVIFINPETLEQTVVIGVFNDIAKLADFRGVPDVHADRASISIEHSTLREAGISPARGWFVEGAPNSNMAGKRYRIDPTPDVDNQLERTNFFLLEVGSNEWRNT